MRIIGGLEMVRYNNNRGVGIIGGGVLGETENSPFLGKHGSVIYLCEQLLDRGSKRSNKSVSSFTTISLNRKI